MAEKQTVSRHYQALINQVSLFEHAPIEILQAHFTQIHARLNPETSLNKQLNCPGCFVLRNIQNHENVQEPPISKKQNKRLKRIQKLRKMKNQTKKQQNMLKKLLMRKNGFQVKSLQKNLKN